jgi:hypothetical protein
MTSPLLVELIGKAGSDVQNVDPDALVRAIEANMLAGTPLVADLFGSRTDPQPVVTQAHLMLARRALLSPDPALRRQVWDGGTLPLEEAVAAVATEPDAHVRASIIAAYPLPEGAAPTDSDTIAALLGADLTLAAPAPDVIVELARAADVPVTAYLSVDESFCFHQVAKIVASRAATAVAVATDPTFSLVLRLRAATHPAVPQTEVHLLAMEARSMLTPELNGAAYSRIFDAVLSLVTEVVDLPGPLQRELSALASEQRYSSLTTAIAERRLRKHDSKWKALTQRAQGIRSRAELLEFLDIATDDELAGGPNLVSAVFASPHLSPEAMTKMGDLWLRHRRTSAMAKQSAGALWEDFTFAAAALDVSDVTILLDALARSGRAAEFTDAVAAGSVTLPVCAWAQDIPWTGDVAALVDRIPACQALKSRVPPVLSGEVLNRVMGLTAQQQEALSLFRHDKDITFGAAMAAVTTAS